jgi:hypothetical protein
LWRQQYRGWLGYRGTPHMNGQVERTNGMVLQGIKP